MTRAQHTYYRDELWPAAMKTQGWDQLPRDQQERLRRALTLEASGMKSDSCSDIDHLDGFTALKNLILTYVDPLNLKAARKMANPEETKAQDQRGRLIAKINAYGFHRNYVQAIAKWYCRESQVTNWEDLPAKRLTHLLYTVNKNRLKKGMPDPDRKPQPTGHPVKEYQMKPRRQVAPAGSDNCPY